MVQLTALWLPILLAAVFVFVASSIIHMVLGYHRSDFGKVANEDDVMNALRKFDIPPGDYLLPCAGGPEGMKSPEFQEKMKKGPVAIFTIIKSGGPSMGKNLILWFVYCVVVSVFAAYISGRALGPRATYLDVFRFAGSTAFAGYSLGLLQNSIWWSRKWTTTLKSMIDGLIYALLTAGTFGWLWPR
ncbi:MAG TPA: hypothetical protein VLM38_07465 [Blastocatellia bacterium]|nr:hypothetical protein [Blastocatellia bacterium]